MALVPSGQILTASGTMNLKVACFVMLLSACSSGDPAASSGSAVKSGSAKASTSGSAKVKASASVAASTTPAASGSAQPSEQKRKMSNCASSVANAKTEIKDIDKGVEITVTASEKADVDEIKVRAKDVTERVKSEAKKEQHSGEGGGAGVMGRCPIVLSGTDVAVKDVDKGAVFTVTAKDDKEVEWLRREAKERLAALQEPEKGDRKMSNCPSAVAGSKTTVKDTADAVVVTVVAKDAKEEAAVKEIRERAKKIAEGKHESTAKDHHAGDGDGAGAGRCPAVLEGATASAKDVDGGSEITLKPKAGGDVKKLAQEAQDRAKNFD